MRRTVTIFVVWLLLIFSGNPLSARNAIRCLLGTTAPVKSIVEFVERVTREGAPDYVKPEERIATFDHDGTLWAEQPMYFQIMFAMDRVRALAPKHPDWKTKQPFKAVLDRDIKALAALGETGFLKIMAVTHTGMTTDASRSSSPTGSPRRATPFRSALYRAGLPADAGAVELSPRQRFQDLHRFRRRRRVHARLHRTCLRHSAQIVGSSGVVKYQLPSTGKPVLVKDSKIEFVDDGPGKPVGINRFIGRPNLRVRKF